MMQAVNKTAVRAPAALCRLRPQGLAQLADLRRRVRGHDLADVGGRAAVPHHGRFVASDLFLRLYGVLGFAAYAAHPALHCGHFGDTTAYEEEETE